MRVTTSSEDPGGNPHITLIVRVGYALGGDRVAAATMPNIKAANAINRFISLSFGCLIPGAAPDRAAVTTATNSRRSRYPSVPGDHDKCGHLPAV